MLKKWLFVYLVWLSVTLTACGWQLRDTQLVPEHIGSLHLSSNDTHSALITELNRALNLYGVKVVSSIADAEYSVVIVDFRRYRQTSTINSNARVAEYQLNEDIDFLIVDKAGNQLIPLSTASAERQYEFDEQDVLASANEERLVRDSMRKEMVRQILNYLSLVPVKSEDTR